MGGMSARTTNGFPHGHTPARDRRAAARSHHARAVARARADAAGDLRPGRARRAPSPPPRRLLARRRAAVARGRGARRGAGVRAGRGAEPPVAGEAPRLLALPGAADRGRLAAPARDRRRSRPPLPDAEPARHHRPPWHPGHDGASAVRGPRRRADAAPAGERHPRGRVPRALRRGRDPRRHGALQRPPQPRRARAGDGAAPHGQRGHEERRRGRLPAAATSRSRS